MKRIVFNVRHAVGNRDRCQPGTILKRIPSDRRHAFGNGNGRQDVETGKRGIADGGHGNGLERRRNRNIRLAVEVRDAGDGRLSAGNRETPVDAAHVRDINAVRPRPDERVGFVPVLHGTRSGKTGLLPPAGGKVRAGQADTLYRRAAGEGVGPYGRQTVRKGNLRQRGASGKRIVSDVRHAVGNRDRRQPGTIVKRIISDARHAVGNDEIRDFFIVQEQTMGVVARIPRAGAKRDAAPCRQVGNMDFRQSGTTGKRIDPDARHTVRNRD